MAEWLVWQFNEIYDIENFIIFYNLQFQFQFQSRKDLI